MTRSSMSFGWGLEHRTLESIFAIGVDEIQYAKGHKYLTLVYQIDAGIHPPAVGRQGTHHRILPRLLYRDRREAGCARFCLSAPICGSPTWTSSARNAPRRCISSTASTSWPR